MSSRPDAISAPATPPLAFPVQPRFHAASVTVAAVAGLATLGTLWVSLPASAMFLGWIAYCVSGPGLRESIGNLFSFLFGLVFGIGTALVIARLTPGLGSLATPVAVTGVVVLVLSLRNVAPLNNGLAYFLGLTSFFYSGLPPEGTSFGVLASAGVIGAGSAAVAGLLQARVERSAS